MRETPMTAEGQAATEAGRYQLEFAQNVPARAGFGGWQAVARNLLILIGGTMAIRIVTLI